MRRGIVFLLVLTILSTTRAVITVRTSGGDYDNFQAAVNAAAGTETIVVGDGTYIGTGNHDITIDADGINLTIESENGPAVCIIDAQNLGRVFGLLNVNSGDTVTIRGFTIENGIAPDTYGGGGVYNHNSVLTLENCIIINNSSTKGGGIYNGGIAGSLTMTDCRIENNTTTASSSGGGMYVGSNSLVASSCIFKNNTVADPAMHAGCIYAEYGDLHFTNCIFDGNSANGSGGVIFAVYTDAVFTNCTFVNNTCTANGGVGFLSGSTTYDDNWLTNVTVKNCIFYNNSADGTSDIFQSIVQSGSAANGVVLNYSYSDLDPAELGGNGTITDLGGNINTDPLFAAADDCHLKSMVGRYYDNPAAGPQWVIDEVHSPCIDAGDPADAYALEPTPNGSHINMGAYGNTPQASKSPYCAGTLTADLNNDCQVNMLDFAEMASQWLNCDKIPQALCP